MTLSVLFASGVQGSDLPTELDETASASVILGGGRVVPARLVRAKDSAGYRAVVDVEKGAFEIVALGRNDHCDGELRSLLSRITLPNGA